MKSIQSWEKHVLLTHEWMQKSLQLKSEDLLKKSDEKSWNIAQVMNHLFIVEFASLTYVQKKILVPEKLQKISFKDHANRFLLKIALYLPFKYKAPAVVAQVQIPENYEVFIENWKQTQSQWENLIKKMDPQIAKKGIFKHPIGIRMNLNETISFMTEHFKHHIPQLNKLFDK